MSVVERRLNDFDLQQQAAAAAAASAAVPMQTSDDDVDNICNRTVNLDKTVKRKLRGPICVGFDVSPNSACR